MKISPSQRNNQRTKIMIRSVSSLCAVLSLLLTACSKENPPVAGAVASAAADKPAMSAAKPAATTGLMKSDMVDKGWLAKAVAEYPLTTCPVSGSKLGSMGKPIDYVWKQAGQPDRLVRFCCPMCPPDFEKEPAKFLAMIEAAAKTMK